MGHAAPPRDPESSLATPEQLREAVSVITDPERAAQEPHLRMHAWLTYARANGVRCVQFPLNQERRRLERS